MSIDKMRQRGYAFSCVLNDNGADVFKKCDYIVKKMLDSEFLIKFIACIMHDMDEDEFHNKKTKHYHLVFTVHFNMTIKNALRILVNTFSCNENQISIEKCTDVCSQVRYLIHLDDSDKYQYLPFDISSNNQLMVAEYLSKVVCINDTKDVDAICDDCHFDLRKIARVMGDVQFKKWLWYIQATKRDLYR